MGTTMSGLVECWIEPNKEYNIPGHWESFAEIEFNKWHEVKHSIYEGNYKCPIENELSLDAKRIIREDIGHGYCVVDFEELEKIWKNFNSTAMATVEFMRVMSLDFKHVRLFIYFC